MHHYRVRVSGDNTERLFALGWRKIRGSDEWLFSAESEEQVRAAVERVLPGQAYELAKIAAEIRYVLTTSRG